jgi:hypothetical protein
LPSLTGRKSCSYWAALKLRAMLLGVWCRKRVLLSSGVCCRQRAPPWSKSRHMCVGSCPKRLVTASDAVYVAPGAAWRVFKWKSVKCD